MKKCKNPVCVEDAEAERYEFCKHCWWEQDPRNKDPKTPYSTSKDRNKDVTVAMMRDMLKDLPDDYLISFDGAYGRVVKGDFTVYHDSKEISING